MVFRFVRAVEAEAETAAEAVVRCMDRRIRMAASSSGRGIAKDGAAVYANTQDKAGRAGNRGRKED